NDDPTNRIGHVVTIDPIARTVDIKKTKKTLDVHPVSVFAHSIIGPKPKDAALVQLGTTVADFGFPAPNRPSLMRDLLTRAVPRGLAAPGTALRQPSE